MKVRVSGERCQGHVMCVLACPEVFLVNDDDGHAYVAQEVVAKEYEERVLLAVRGCPEKAIEAFEP